MNFKSYAYRSGRSLEEVKNIYEKALKESDCLGMSDNLKFVEDIFTTMLGLNEEDYEETLKKLNNRFKESGYTDFHKFLEDTLNSVSFYNLTPTANPVAVIDLPPSGKGHKVRPNTSNDIDEVKNAKIMNFKVIKKKQKKDKDPRGEKLVKDSIKKINKEDL